MPNFFRPPESEAHNNFVIYVNFVQQGDYAVFPWLADGFHHLNLIVSPKNHSPICIEYGFFTGLRVSWSNVEKMINSLSRYWTPGAFVRVEQTRTLEFFHGDEYPLELPWCFTCVHVAKRILGIRKWWIQTPWQLYNYLMDLPNAEEL